MQLTTAITTLFALTATVIAAPAEIEVRGGGGSTPTPTPAPTTGSCSASSQAQVCCDTLLLNCLVQLIGETCTTNAYCCSTDEPAGTLINLSLLNCVQL
ncbi:hypothetical protein F4779DRAFT_618567 [Xylariaceae sp. FL0662B]|nr:hypothetical protein F4779DRAFT_618567 [Xylariaceae sp. FL0662B]